ncbi:hypothetical protein [Devosia algicola]|uniref:hypothetical protein n=1 Tax=Devosia algicola TaxID=3026418 RepID=UPI0038994EF0
MSRISVEVEGGVEQAVKDCAVAVTRTVINATPVDTGRARSNWTAEPGPGVSEAVSGARSRREGQHGHGQCRNRHPEGGSHDRAIRHRQERLDPHLEQPALHRRAQ